MTESFRGFLDRLRQKGELVDLHQAVDIRHIATLVDQAKTALYFHNVIGYDMPVVSGIIRSRERAIMSMGCETYELLRLLATVRRVDPGRLLDPVAADDSMPGAGPRARVRLVPPQSPDSA